MLTFGNTFLNFGGTYLTGFRSPPKTIRTHGVIGFNRSSAFNQDNYYEWVEAPVFNLDENLNVITSVYVPHNCLATGTDKAFSDIWRTKGSPVLVNGEPLPEYFTTNLVPNQKGILELDTVLTSNNTTSPYRVGILGSNYTSTQQENQPTYGAFVLAKTAFSGAEYDIQLSATIEMSARISGAANFGRDTKLWGVYQNSVVGASQSKQFTTVTAEVEPGIFEAYVSGTVASIKNEYTNPPVYGTRYGWVYNIDDGLINYNSAYKADYAFIRGTWSAEGTYTLPF